MEELKKEILGLVDLYEESGHAVYPGNIVGHFYRQGYTRFEILETMEKLRILNRTYTQELELIRRRKR